MKKRLMIFLLVFVSLFAFNSVSAETTTCNYKLSSEKIEYIFSVKSGEVQRGSISGEINNDEIIQNWDKELESSSYVAETDYKNNNYKCPEYIIISKSNTGYNVFASDSNSIDSIKAAIKNKYSTIKEGYPKVLPKKGSQEELQDKEEYENNLGSSCMSFNDDPVACKNGYRDDNNDGEPDSELQFSCIWNDNEFGEYCNVDNLLYVRCADSFDIPYQAPKIISFLITFLKVVIPIVLIFVAIISLLKAVGAANEDEIKKAQKSLIRKMVAAVLAFFVISIVQFVIMKVAYTGDVDDISSCLSCFMNNDCGNTLYYKTNVGGTYFCTDSNGTEPCE